MIIGWYEARASTIRAGRVMRGGTVDRSRGLGIRKLFEGHYRSLEDRFGSLIRGFPVNSSLTVVAANSSQLERLRRITLEVRGSSVIGGVRFLPGMVDLAAKLCTLPVKADKVSHADRTLFALAAMEATQSGEPLYDLRGNAETAHSLAGFFEDLLDQGVGSSAYLIQAASTPEDSTTVDVVGRVFQAYQEARDRCYPATDSAIAAMPMRPDASGDFVFYGFYDLNPGQRAVVRRLAACQGISIHWFSPLGDLSPWSPVYARTREFLNRLGIAETDRCWCDIEMSSFASLFERLPSRTAMTPPPEGFRITAASGPMGCARAVLSRIGELSASGVPLPSVAVVCRGRGERMLITRLAVHEGVPVASGLEADARELPLGRLLESLLDVEVGEFHYTTFQKLAMSGCLRPDVAPRPGEVVDAVLSTGIRMGRERWRDWYAAEDRDEKSLHRLMAEVGLFYDGLPERAAPAEFARRLESLLVSLLPGDPGRLMLDLLLDRDVFRSPEEVEWSRFAAALRIHLRSVGAVLTEGSSDGFRVMSPEQARGGLFRCVILTGLEDGVWPQSSREDPRLPDGFLTMLELPLRKDRELEDGFLLRQVAEAASETLDLVHMQRDAKGDELYPSPFLAPLLAQADRTPLRAGWRTVETSSPFRVLLGGTSAGQARAMSASRGDFQGAPSFLGCVISSEGERLGPGPFGAADGAIGGSFFEGTMLTASRLESYVRCPFVFLAEKVWGLEERRGGGVSAEPDPLIHGNIVHSAVDTLVTGYGFTDDAVLVRDALEGAARHHRLEAALGSRELERLFLGRCETNIRRSVRALAQRGWRPLDAEVSLEGELGGIAIRGRLDLVLEDESGKLVVLDLKTGNLPRNRETVEGTRFQLPFYHVLASGRDHGRLVSGVYYVSISDREPGRLEGFSGEKMEEMLPAVASRAGHLFSMMCQGFFPPYPLNPGACDGCGFRHLCRLTPKERLLIKAAADPRLAVREEEE
jgi:RecB family exonuclease